MSLYEFLADDPWAKWADDSDEDLAALSRRASAKVWEQIEQLDDVLDHLAIEMPPQSERPYVLTVGIQ